MDNKAIISEIKDTLHNIMDEGIFILYGSRARGDFRQDSDVDLMILLPSHYTDKQMASANTRITESLFQLHMKWGFNIEISPVIIRESAFNERKTPFTINVINEGIIL